MIPYSVYCLLMFRPLGHIVIYSVVIYRCFCLAEVYEQVHVECNSSSEHVSHFPKKNLSIYFPRGIKGNSVQKISE